MVFLFFSVLIIYYSNLHKNNIEIISTNKTVYGDVMGGVSINGNIRTEQILRDVPFLLWNYDSYQNANQYFRLRIWNITSIMIKDDFNGSISYTNYSVQNNDLIIETKNVSAYFTCNIKYAIFKINFSRIFARNEDGYFNMDLNYSSLRCEGELNHQLDDYHLDFELLSRREVRIGNKTIKIFSAHFSIPFNQTARFELIAIGRGVIKPTPMFTVNGTMQINNFREENASGHFYRNIEQLVMRSSNITVLTLTEPYSGVQDHERNIYIIPWKIKIEVHD